MKNNYFKFSLLVFALFVSLGSAIAQNLSIKPIDLVENLLIDSLTGQLVGSIVIVEKVFLNLKETSVSLATFKAPQQHLEITAKLVMVKGRADSSKFNYTFASEEQGPEISSGNSQWFSPDFQSLG